MRKSTPQTAIATIYKLLDPRTNEVRYVGATIHLHERYMQHLRSANLETSKKAHWIRALKAEGLKPEIVVIQETTVALMDELELFWIRHYLKKGYRLLNTFMEK